MGKPSKAVKEIKSKIYDIEMKIMSAESVIRGETSRINDLNSQREVLAQVLVTLEAPKVRKNEVKV